jgi:hypothetical protein
MRACADLIRYSDFGNHGYVGGRWRADDGDGIMEEGELFLCPLLGPGRTSP